MFNQFISNWLGQAIDIEGIVIYCIALSVSTELTCDFEQVNQGKNT